MTISCPDKSSLTAAMETILAAVRPRAARPLDVVAPPECEIDRAAPDGLGATAGGAAHSPNEVEIRRRYQDRPFAQRYLRAYEGPIRLRTLAAQHASGAALREP
jgi:hypothetical protein